MHALRYVLLLLKCEAGRASQPSWTAIASGHDLATTALWVPCLGLVEPRKSSTVNLHSQPGRGKL
jgi:hypothetical protein